MDPDPSQRSHVLPLHSPPIGEPELVRRVRTNHRHPHPGHVQPSRPRAGPVPHPPPRHQTRRHPPPEPGLVPARPSRLLSHRVRRSLVSAADAAVAQRRFGCGIEAAAFHGHHRKAVQESRLLDHIHVPGRRHGVHLHPADQAGAGEAPHMRCVSFLSVFNSVADPDPGSDTLLTPGSGIRNSFFPDLRSQIPTLYF